IAVSIMQEMQVSIDFLRFIQPMAVGIVAYSAYRISSSVISSRVGYFLMILSAFISYFLKNPFVFPFLLLAGGVVTATRYKRQEIEEKSKFKINWTNFLIWVAVMIAAAALWRVTDWFALRLFDNFYRNGSLIFGGGQVLVPLLFTEFVEFKKYLTSEEFISGYALVQAVPGPVFSFSSYVGALSMRDWGVGGQILGGLTAAAGIFLPGTFFIFFAIRFWESLKKYRVVKASLEGINAVSSGMVLAATFLLFETIEPIFINYVLMIGTACLIFFTRFPTPVIILIGLLVGIILK
ncbi:MAG: chromate transporter, partial [Bacteroidota bacterium]